MLVCNFFIVQWFIDPNLLLQIYLKSTYLEPLRKIFMRISLLYKQTTTICRLHVGF